MTAASYDFSAPTAVSITSGRIDDEKPVSVVHLLTVAGDHAAAVEVLARFVTDRGITAPEPDGFGGFHLVDGNGERTGYRGEHAWEDGLRDAMTLAGYTVAMSI